MSHQIPDNGKPVTLRAAFLDAAGNEAAGTVSFGSTGPLTLTPHPETRTVDYAPSGALGDATVTATLTEPGGSTLSATPWNVTVVATGATTGAFQVVTDPNAPTPPTPAPTP